MSADEWASASRYSFLVTLYREMDAETERGCVLVGAAALDESLGEALAAKFNHLSPGITPKELEALIGSGMHTPLGSFAARALAAFAVGIIDRPSYDALAAVRKMRNHAAHITRPVRFEDYDWQKFFAAIDPRLLAVIRIGPADNPKPVRKVFTQVVGLLVIGLQLATGLPEKGMATWRLLENEIGKAFGEIPEV